MLNIITGIFVDSAITTTKTDHDEVITAHLHAEDSVIKAMQKIFEDADHDKSGSITIEEFDVHLADPRMRAHLESIGVDVGEAEGLFNLLDLDNSGAVTVDEFLFGCMRLKGAAKAVDVQTLLYENKKMFAKWNVFTSYVENEFVKVKHCLGQNTIAVQRLQTKADRSRTDQPSGFRKTISPQTNQSSWLRDVAASAAQVHVHVGIHQEAETGDDILPDGGRRSM